MATIHVLSLHGKSLYFLYHNYSCLNTGSHHGSITEFSVVLFQPVHFVSDGRVMDRGQQSISLLHHGSDGSIMGLNHLQQSLETQTDVYF